MGFVCVVDDDAAVLRLLGQTLRDGGQRVELLDCGKALLARVDLRHFDLILLDLGLPDLDGECVLQALRAEHPEVRVMVLSAREGSAARVRCLDAGACDFVAKPFDLSELLARVRAHLRPAFLSTDGTGIGSPSAALDLVGHRLVTHGRTIQLAPREFLLLRYMRDRIGRVCTREELLREVWGYDFETDSNVVDKYISRLRARLPEQMIDTVRNVGYSFHDA